MKQDLTRMSFPRFFPLNSKSETVFLQNTERLSSRASCGKRSAVQLLGVNRPKLNMRIGFSLNIHVMRASGP